MSLTLIVICAIVIGFLVALATEIPTIRARRELAREREKLDIALAELDEVFQAKVTSPDDEAVLHYFIPKADITPSYFVGEIIASAFRSIGESAIQARYIHTKSSLSGEQLDRSAYQIGRTPSKNKHASVSDLNDYVCTAS